MKPSVLVFIVLFFLGISPLRAQIHTWAIPIVNDQDNVTYDIATDAAGNVYATGYFNGVVDFDPSVEVVERTSAGSFDIFLAKYSSNGRLVWVNTFGGSEADIAFGLCLDDLGNIYLTGYFMGTVDFDPTGNQLNLTGTSDGLDIFFAKFTPSGNVVFAKSMGGDSYDAGTDIAVDAERNIYITGVFELTADLDPGPNVKNFSSRGMADIFMAKFDAMGNYVWVKSIGSAGSEEPRSIALDRIGNLCLVGVFGSPLDVDPDAGVTQLTSKGNTDAFICMYSTAGELQFASSIGGANNDQIAGAVFDRDGDVIVTGYCSGTVDFDLGLGTENLTTVFDDDVFVARYTVSGTLKWAFTIQSGAVVAINHNIAVDAGGNVYLTGAFYGTADFDPSSGTATLTADGNYDFFIAGYSANGRYLFALHAGDQYRNSSGNAIDVDVLGNVLVAGNFGGRVDFDPGPNIDTLNSYAAQGMFIAKYTTPFVSVPQEPTGIPGVDFGYAFPNPSSDVIILPTCTDPTATINICGLSGQSMLSLLYPTNGVVTLADLPPSVYTVVITANSRTRAFQIVKQ